MEPTHLNPEAIRKIGLRLYGAEKFQADPATVILDTIAWVDAVLGDSEAQPFSLRQDAEIQRLIEVVRIKGVPTVAAELKVSAGALKSWISGFYSPTRSNLEKVRKYLQDHETAPNDAAEAKESARSGELFGQPQEPESESTRN
jgi:hypothetical protein